MRKGDALKGLEIFSSGTLSIGVIPQISVIMGPCAGGAVYSRHNRLCIHGGKDQSDVYNLSSGNKGCYREDVTFENLAVQMHIIQ